jgi:hypothetical protein
MPVPLRRLAGFAAIVALIGTTVVAILAAVILGADVRSNTAAAVALGAVSILGIVGAIVLYRRQPKPSATEARTRSEIWRERRNGLGALAVLALLWWVGSYVSIRVFPTYEWAYRWRYALEDGMTGAAVQIEPKPHDCEFLTAPVGTKHCHYDASVTTVRVRMDGSKKLVSYDEGVTWEATDRSENPSVFVAWHRLED